MQISTSAYESEYSAALMFFGGIRAPNPYGNYICDIKNVDIDVSYTLPNQTKSPNAYVFGILSGYFTKFSDEANFPNYNTNLIHAKNVNINLSGTEGGSGVAVRVAGILNTGATKIFADDTSINVERTGTNENGYCYSLRNIGSGFIKESNCKYDNDITNGTITKLGRAVFV